MAFTFSIVLFFVALIAIIMIHELGHYLVARGFGFRVLEYFVGFGPRLWSTRKGEIEYGVKAIPAGGYVKIAGMNPLEDDVPPGDEDRAYFAKPIWQRALVIAAGPLSHFLVAGLIFASLLFFYGRGGEVSLIGEVPATVADLPGPAATAGIEPGDIIVRIGDVENPDWTQLGVYLAEHPAEEIEVVVVRAGERITVAMTPVIDEIDGQEVPRLGIVLSPQRQPLLTSLAGGFTEVWDNTVLSVGEIGRVFGPEGVGRTFELLFTDEPRDVRDPASAWGISRTVGSVGAQGDWATFLYLFAYVTLFVGLVNLIPLPPFDGGHLAVLVIEKVRGRRVDMRKLIPVSAVVLTFLVLFTFATLILDIAKPIPVGP
jgi:membrane-associated protease RseP (regulator of RpoE activity)